MAPDFPERVASVPWHSFATAYGTGHQVGQWLIDLTAADWDTTSSAAHSLWCSLCHQHAYVSPAAAPALPFLLEVAGEAEDRLLIELLDIFLGLASCSRPPGSAWPAGGEWVDELWNGLRSRGAWFEKLKESQNDEVAGLATEVVTHLGAGQ